MANRYTNLERRGDIFYYRAAFTLDGKICEIRLSLKTGDLRMARARAAHLDRLLKERWRQILSVDEGLSETDRMSILREAALKARDSFEKLHAREQHDGYDDAEETRCEQLRTLRCMDLVARDVFAHGFGPGFGSFDHFEARFLDAMPDLPFDDAKRVQEILGEAVGLRDGIQEAAEKALLRRNLALTPANLVLARQQMMMGTILAMRDLQKAVAAPDVRIDEVLASLSLDTLAAEGQGGPTGSTSPSVRTEPTTEATLPVPTAPSSPTGSCMSIRAAAEAFLAANPKFDADHAASRWTAKTRTQFDAAVFLADKHFGPHADVRTIDETQIAAFFRILRGLPRAHHKTPAHAGMTLEAIAESNKGEGLSLATTNRHMRFLKLIFQWVARRTPDAPLIEWSAFVEADTRVKRNKRDAFKVGELEVLFHGAVWTGCESRTRRLKPGRIVWQDAAYWVPLLLTYTGARREEIAKAMVDDVEQVEGIWCLRIRVTQTGRIKNEASERDVPIAAELMRLGFLEFVEGMHADGHTELFPELKMGGANYGDAFYKRWWRAFMRAGLVPKGKDMHSIRHFVATELAMRDVIEERRADLLGHTIDTSETARTYTKRTRLEILLKVVDTIPIVSEHLKKMPFRRM